MRAVAKNFFTRVLNHHGGSARAYIYIIIIGENLPYIKSLYFRMEKSFLIFYLIGMQVLNVPLQSAVQVETHTLHPLYAMILIWGCRISWRHFCSGVRSLPSKSALDMTRNNLMVRLQFWSFQECRVLFYCHYSQVHLEW